MYKSEAEIMEELLESIYSGETALIDDDEEKKDDEEETEKSSDTSSEEKDTDSEGSDTSNDNSEDDSKEDDNDSNDDSSEDDNDSDDESDEESDDEESDDESEISQDSYVSSELKNLQDQYNDILVRAFEEYAPSAIREALEEFDSGFGENIEVILDNAWKKLRDRILKDMGVEEPAEAVPDANAVDVIHPTAMGGGFDPAAAFAQPMEIEIAQ